MARLIKTSSRESGTKHFEFLISDFEFFIAIAGRICVEAFMSESVFSNF